MCVFKNHAFIYFLRPPSWSGTVIITVFSNGAQHCTHPPHSHPTPHSLSAPYLFLSLFFLLFFFLSLSCLCFFLLLYFFLFLPLLLSHSLPLYLTLSLSLSLLFLSLSPLSPPLSSFSPSPRRSFSLFLPICPCWRAISTLDLPWSET